MRLTVSLVDAELGGDGAHPPVLDEVVAQDLRLELVVDRHRARHSVPGATTSASSYRRAPPLQTDELADRARTVVAVHLRSAARCASSLGGRFGGHRRIRLAHRNPMTGECTTASGRCGPTRNAGAIPGPASNARTTPSPRRWPRRWRWCRAQCHRTELLPKSPLAKALKGVGAILVHHLHRRRCASLRRG